MQSYKVQKWIKNVASDGSTRPNINAKQLGQIPISLPSKEIQEKIANSLWMIDTKIKLNNQINDNLFALSKIIFDHILGNKTIKFSQISTIQNGYAFKSKEYITDKQLMILRTKNRRL